MLHISEVQAQELEDYEMSLERINDYILKIQPLDSDAMERARHRQSELVKPPGSLGKLEEISIRLAGISGDVFYNTDKRCVIIMSADNGVYEEGVAATPQSVTYIQTINFIRGINGVAAIANHFNTDLIVVDVGINADVAHPQIINRKIRKSTWNIAKGPAMTYDEAVSAILVGIETAIEATKSGYTLLGAGEMGIANTTTSAAVLSVLTGIGAERAAGKGAGLTDKAYEHKVHVIRTAIENNKPNPVDAIDVLAKVGGFDLAALAGVFIGGAVMRVPVVIDGFISMVAALAAARIAPLAKEYMIASHVSFEHGFVSAAGALELEPCLNLEMRLGEGSGCPIMFSVIDAACAVMKNMATFAEAEINDEYLEEIRIGDKFSV